MIRHVLLPIEIRGSGTNPSRWVEARVNIDAIVYYEPCVIANREGGGDHWGARAFIDILGFVGVDLPVHQIDALLGGVGG